MKVAGLPEQTVVSGVEILTDGTTDEEIEIVIESLIAESGTAHEELLCMIQCITSPAEGT